MNPLFDELVAKFGGLDMTPEIIADLSKFVGEVLPGASITIHGPSLVFHCNGISQIITAEAPSFGEDTA